MPIAAILGSLPDDMTPEEIQQAYPQSGSDDIQATLAYAANAIRQEVRIKLPA